MKKTARIAAIASIAALALAGCGERPAEEATAPTTTEETTSSAPAQSNPDFKACMVSDSGGFDDKSFNQTSYQGMMDAKEALGIETGEVESQSDSEYQNNIASLVRADCDQITTVGFLLGDATEAAAKKNPEVDFAIVDFAYENPAPNLKGLTFNTAEPSYLAGYLAAAESENGVVGTLGGLNIPTVTVFMEGFRQGVERYNEDNGTQVQVLGWDGETGSFTEDFEDKTKGQSVAQQMIQQGADVIFPVAGPAGLGALQAAQDADVRAIWVDTDGCESAAEYCDILLTSVVKGLDVAVQQAITDSLEGDFTNEVYVGTLENEGVGLAPFHEQEGEIDQETKDALDQLREEIIAGDIQVG